MSQKTVCNSLFHPFSQADGKTVVKSFRISEEALVALKEEAYSQTVSLNTLANQLIFGYANFGRHLERVGSIMLTLQALGEFINSLSEESAINAGRSLGKTSPQQLMALDGEISYARVIELIHNLSSWANWFQYTHRTEGDHMKITLTHGMGRKWSQFITHYLNGAFEAVGNRVRSEISDRYVILTI